MGGALPSKGGGIWDAPPGGVAVIVKMGIPARGTVLPKTEAADPLTHHLHHLTWWLHVQMAVGEGAAVLHIQAVYGIVDAPDLNAQLMEKVFEHSSHQGNTPQIIGGDFNSKSCGSKTAD